MERYEEILEFWFGGLTGPDDVPEERMEMWFQRGKELDPIIRERFLEDIEKAATGAYADWMEAPHSALALVLLMDQFPRHAFRGTPKMFAYDGEALQVTEEGLARDFHLDLYPVERMFFYLPLEHTEDLEAQERCVILFEDLVEVSPETVKELARQGLRYAVRHRDIIARFGRFPHRNAVLGRESSDEEIAFLKEPFSSF